MPRALPRRGDGRTLQEDLAAQRRTACRSWGRTATASSTASARAACGRMNMAASRASAASPSSPSRATLPCNFTMTRRGLPLAAIFAIGNQADIDIAAMLEALADDERITAIGLHIEGLTRSGGLRPAADGQGPQPPKAGDRAQDRPLRAGRQGGDEPHQLARRRRHALRCAVRALWHRPRDTRSPPSSRR